MSADPSPLDRLRETAARWIATLTGDTRTTAQARVDQVIAAAEARHDAAAVEPAAAAYHQAVARNRALACQWAAHAPQWEAEMTNPLRPRPAQHRPYDQETDR